MSASPPVKPWYREIWPWLLMLPPFASVVGGVTMVYLAVGSPVALVVDDYARIEEITRERFDAERRAADLGLAARVAFAPAGDGVSTVTVRLTGQRFDAPGEIVLRLRHAAHAAADRMLVLEGAGGAYRGVVDLVAGRYELELGPTDGEWRLARTVTPGGSPVELGAAWAEAGP